MNEDELNELPPSKSQRKRDMQALKDTAEQLTHLSKEQLSTLPMPDVIEAVAEAKKITKGNARKRQVQLIAKMLSKIDAAPAQQLLDELDASSTVHVQKFHRLEVWREKLLANDDEVMSEILAEFPEMDRQQLRQLVRAAIKEQQAGDERASYRKLFQFLKGLSA